MTTSVFDEHMDRLTAGERLSASAVQALAAGPDILPLGMLADAVRRRLHGARVTYLRVARCAFDGVFSDAVGSAAGEVRITGAPDTVVRAISAVESARAIAGTRAVSGFAWPDLEHLAEREQMPVKALLERLAEAGLDAVAEVPLDVVSDPDAVIEGLRDAGFKQLRLAFDRAPAEARTALLLKVAGLQDRHACIQAVNPLPTRLNSVRPTTGYEDVKMVAIARLAAPNVPTIQVDWMRYGPKLAQVALTFGADDIDDVSASEAAPDGRRRAPLEEIRRNVEAAGFEPVERDGRFVVA